MREATFQQAKRAGMMEFTIERAGANVAGFWGVGKWEWMNAWLPRMQA
jgi:hypothetical protein